MSISAHRTEVLPSCPIALPRLAYDEEPDRCRCDEDEAE